jgi:molecular chaperone GrpE
MVSFRREKKRRSMQENKAADESRASAPETSSAEEIRVTDRRRVNLDGEAGDKDETEKAGDAQPSLKPSYVEQLELSKQAAEQKLVEVQARFEQLRTQLQRETDETRQRLNRAADERARREKAEFVSALLPVIDNLYRAIESADSAAFEALLEGVRGTANGFENALMAAGVEPVESVGAQFDPELHEAVDTVEVEPERDGTVTAEYSRGYRMGERLLRPARVQVGRAQGEARQAAE